MSVDDGDGDGAPGWPAPAPPPTPPPFADEHAEYRPLTTAARILSGVLAFGLALDLLLAVLTGSALASLGTASGMLDAFSAIDGAYLARILVYVGSAACFIWWFRRAYANLPALGHGRRHGVGWSIGAWFVPILNLFRPKQIANELWAAGDPPAATSHPPALINWWWGLFLFSTWIDTRAASLASRPQTPGELRNSLLVDVASYLLSAAAAAVAIAFVVRASNRQDARAATSHPDCGFSTQLGAEKDVARQ